ncbi:sugar ABC transporter ATP-binding protein [Actinomadura miaoliensis]|uniref:Sugar ABC transporter ATP-binding protein n=1 Tax=Actinomadura miaoliensis TaxID=430685 RepID=A0ABP7X4D3_9ACTN
MEEETNGAGEPLLRLTGVRRRYGGVQALRGVDFEVRAGEVHALVGENGAGKSTLIKIISGAEAADAGTVEMAGRTLPGGSTAAAFEAGIATVYQEPQLFGELPVAENIFIGRELRRRGMVDRAAQRRRAVELLRRLGLDPGLADVRVADLPVAQRQLVSIAKAFAHEAKVLILDEPSAILTDREIEVLFGVLRSVRSHGVGVIYISHRLDELTVISDRVTVMRDGSRVTTRPTAELTIREIARLMVGHAPVGAAQRRAVPDGPAVLETAGLSRRDAFRDVSFQVRAGEVVALFGLVGSGTGAIARALYGIDPPDAGTLRVAGREVRPRTPADAVAAGLAMLPGDRKAQGVFASKSIGFNISVGHLPVLSRARVWVDRARERAVASQFIERIRIKAPGPATPVGTLSGGNQQKVVLARQLVERPPVLVLEEPTQGVDVGAKDEIHDLVLGLADEGSAVLVVSSDLPETIRLADRVLVVRGGRIVGEFPHGAAQADVLAAAAGDSGDAAGDGADQDAGQDTGRGTDDGRADESGEER